MLLNFSAPAYTARLCPTPFEELYDNIREAAALALSNSVNSRRRWNKSLFILSVHAHYEDTTRTTTVDSASFFHYLTGVLGIPQLSRIQRIRYKTLRFPRLSRFLFIRCTTHPLYDTSIPIVTSIPRLVSLSLSSEDCNSFTIP